MKNQISLSEFLLKQFAGELTAKERLPKLLKDISEAATIISGHVRKIGLSGDIHRTGIKNIQGEEVNSLDLIANHIILRSLKDGGNCAGALSEECDDFIRFEGSEGISTGYLCLFDPLDGSSNIHVGITIGTIFSILPYAVSPSKKVEEGDFYRKGIHQVAAGYIIYGSSTILVYAAKGEVNGFTLDPDVEEFYLSHPGIVTPECGMVYSFNYAYLRQCFEGVRKFIDNCVTDVKDPGIPSTQRYTGSLVADFHRNLVEGGIFISPATKKYFTGKLRLLYECAPLAFIAETAGGIATNGEEHILDILPISLHQRTPLYVGSRKMMNHLQHFIPHARQDLHS